MFQSLVRQLSRVTQPRGSTVEPRPDAEVVVLPQPDGSVSYVWKGGSVASVKAQFLEMLGVSVTDDFFALGPYTLKIIRYDDLRESYICELISTDVKATNLNWSARTID